MAVPATGDDGVAVRVTPTSATAVTSDITDAVSLPGVKSRLPVLPVTVITSPPVAGAVSENTVPVSVTVREASGASVPTSQVSVLPDTVQLPPDDVVPLTPVSAAGSWLVSLAA